MMIDVTLNLVVLRSPNMERTALFYSQLGICFERERHGTGPEKLAAQLGPVVLEVYPQDHEPDSMEVRLGFRVTSVEGAVEAVRRGGGVVLEQPRPTPWGYRAVLADPDGRQVEVSQREDAETP
jgi:predicted enzyme related to lactoylglutathione lyase